MWSFALLISALVTDCAGETCYEPYGCFPLNYPWWSWKRPTVLPPQDPKKINTTFFFYNRNTASDVVVAINSTEQLKRASFNVFQPTIIIVHGFLSSLNLHWVKQLKNALIQHKNCNLIMVNWKQGASVHYGTAVANTRVVGVQIAQMAEFLRRETGHKYEALHIIGHSLGAHIGGYVGHRLKTLGRITGLDPANFYFEDTPPLVRLDPGDALFVDAIHTGASLDVIKGFGITHPVGHVDFYVNGGSVQPHCMTGIGPRITQSLWSLFLRDFKAAFESIFCTHHIPVYMLIESFSTDCAFLAFPCDSPKSFLDGKCTRCQEGQCTRFGMDSNRFSARGTMYLSTNWKRPYCKKIYLVEVLAETSRRRSNNDVSDWRIGISLSGSKGHSNPISVRKRNTLRSMDVAIFQGSVEITEDLGAINEIQLAVIKNRSAFQYDEEIFLYKAIIYTYDKNLQERR